MARGARTKLHITEYEIVIDWPKICQNKYSFHYGINWNFKNVIGLSHAFNKNYSNVAILGSKGK